MCQLDSPECLDCRRGESVNSGAPELDFPSRDGLRLVLLRALLLGARGLHLQIKRGEVVEGRFDSGLRKRAVRPLGFHGIKGIACGLQPANRRARFVEERKAARRLRAVAAIRPQDGVVPAIPHAQAGNSAIARIPCGDKLRSMRTFASTMAFVPPAGVGEDSTE